MFVFYLFIFLRVCVCSGPKRFDVIDGRWRYSHSEVALHDLLQKEFSEILGTNLDFNQLAHSHIISDEGNWAN